MAQRHWAHWLPEHYAAITDPDTFFTVLGDEVARQVDDLTDELAGDHRPGEGTPTVRERVHDSTRR